MACCAFAIFLVTQLLAPFRTLARKLGLGGQWKPDLAVEWRPGLPVSIARKPRRWVRVGLAAIAVDAGLVALVAMPAAASLPASRSPAEVTSEIEAKIHASICGPLGWRE
jgi:hypothetical protein